MECRNCHAEHANKIFYVFCMFLTSIMTFHWSNSQYEKSYSRWADDDYFLKLRKDTHIYRYYAVQPIPGGYDMHLAEIFALGTGQWAHLSCNSILSIW